MIVGVVDSTEFHRRGCTTILFESLRVLRLAWKKIVLHNKQMDQYRKQLKLYENMEEVYILNERCESKLVDIMKILEITVANCQMHQHHQANYPQITKILHLIMCVRALLMLYWYYKAPVFV